MPPYKKVESLVSLTNTLISRAVSDVCVRIEKAETAEAEAGQLRADLERLLEEVPGVLLESLVPTSVSQLVREKERARSAPVPGLTAALQLLPRPHLSQLDFGSLFTGARLSRASNAACRAALVSSLARVSKLSKLVLSSKCTNDILQTLGHNCPLLTELHISVSDLVTDAGLACLVPSVSRSFSTGETEEVE